MCQAATASSSSNAAPDVLAQLVRVRERLRVGEQPEAHAAGDGDDADREGVARGERHGRVHLAQPAPVQVARHGGPGDARDREVRQARVRERVGERALDGRRRQRDQAERGVQVLGVAVAPPLRRGGVDRLQAGQGVGLVARQLEEGEADAVAGSRVVLGRADVGGHHHLQAPRPLAPALGEPPQPAGAGREHDVVGAHAEAPPGGAEVVERARHAHMAARRRAGRVERGARRGRQQGVRHRAGEPGKLADPARRRGEPRRGEGEPRAVGGAVERAAGQPRAR